MAPMVEIIPEADGKAEEDRPVRVRIGHVSAGRIRLRLAEELGAADLAALADRLALMPGIRRVVVRPATGSVILEGNLSAEALTDAVNASEAVKVVPPAPHVPVGQVAKLGLAKADFEVRKKTDNSLDLRAALALLFLIGALIQLARGKIAAPATTLALAALTLMEQSKP